MLIQRLRDGTQGVTTKIIVGLIIVVFGLFGFGSITTFLAPVPTVAVVNGEDITQREMEIAVERQRNILLGEDIPASEIDEDQLRNLALQSLVARRIYAQKAKEFSLYYSDSLLDQQIVDTPVFQVEGRFDPQQFRRMLGGIGLTPMAYRDEIRVDRMVQQMETGMGLSQFITPDELRRINSLQGQQRDFAYLRVPAESFLDQLVVEDAAVQAYYDEHPEEFVTDESAQIEYIELTLDDLAADVPVTEDEVARHYEQTLEDYSAGEARRISHILVATSPTVNEAAAKQKIDQLRAQLLAGGDFAALAKENSDDPGSSEKGGDLGFNTTGTFVPEFDAVAFDLPVDELSEPVLTEFGYHLIKVTAIEDADIPSLEEIRDQVEAAYRKSLVEEDFVSLSARLEELLFESIDLILPAEQSGLEIKTLAEFKRSGNEGVLADPQVVSAAFSQEVLVEGANSELIEVDEDHYLALRVLSHTPSEAKPFASVQEEIKDSLLRSQAAQQAANRAAAIVTAIRGGSLARFVSDEYDLEWEVHNAATRYMPNPAPEDLPDEEWGGILNSAFQLPRPDEGKESLASLSFGNGDGLVLRVARVDTSIQEELDQEELASLTNVLSANLGDYEFQEFREALRRASRVSRN